MRRRQFKNPITPIDIPNSYSYLYPVIIQNILILVKFLKSYPTISADKKNEKKFKFLYKIFLLSSFLITYSIVLNILFQCTIPSIQLLYIKFRRESTVAYLFFLFQQVHRLVLLHGMYIHEIEKMLFFFKK